uniref:Uncharacterized protein n=1 Tax=Romanomermis culicivorax TaxID=13658 RepID=A0A915HJ19_ROMCU
MEQMVQELSNDCLLETKRVTRSRLGKCWHGETAISNKLVNVDQMIEKLLQSDILLNSPKYYGLFTENPIKLFEIVVKNRKHQLWEFVDRYGLIQKLSNINMISNSVTLGIIYKNIAADFYNGDYVEAASGAALLGGDYLISKGFTLLAERMYLQNSKTLGFISPVLKRYAPFLRRFAAGYNFYSLYQSASSYSKNDDTPSVIILIDVRHLCLLT